MMNVYDIPLKIGIYVKQARRVVVYIEKKQQEHSTGYIRGKNVI
jgi:hypothetical protein